MLREQRHGNRDKCTIIIFNLKIRSGKETNLAPTKWLLRYIYKTYNNHKILKLLRRIFNEYYIHTIDKIPSPLILGYSYIVDRKTEKETKA